MLIYQKIKSISSIKNDTGMDKVNLAFTILSIAIIVGPIAGVIYIYRDNLLGLVLPPEVKSLTNGDLAESKFQPPMPAGEPQYDPETKTFTFSFKFTNPLQNEISINQISADVKCKDHNVHLGNVSINEPIKIGPGETVVINASGSWTQEALNHFKAQHCGPEDDDINVAFENLNVDLAGIKVHMDELPDAGWVPLPR
jgi:hypothetical protein